VVLVAQPEDQLALEHLGGFVEVVPVQRRAGAVRRTTISVTSTWPPVSSLRSRTLVVRFGTAGIVRAPFEVLGSNEQCSRAGGLEELDEVP
jgi:hypothetical protein